MPGQLIITTNVQTVIRLSMTSRIINIGESALSEVYSVSGSIFLPPYSAMMHEVDGDRAGFINEYTKHLESPEVQEFIAVILRAIMNNINMVFYLSRDEAELTYANVLTQFLISKYGFYIGTEAQPSYIDNRFIGNIMDLLYQYNLCNHEELIMNTPSNHTYSYIALAKLVRVMNPYISNNPTMEEYQEFFNQYTNQAHQLGKMPILLLHGGVV